MSHILDSGDPTLFNVPTRARGPQGSLPITTDMLLHRPSGDLFGLSQDAGMGWDPSRLGGPEILLLSTHGGIRAADGTPIALGYHTGHWEVGLLMQAAAEELKSAGAVPFAGYCTDPCDGRTQGTNGMFDSLPYRNDAAIIFRRLIRSLPTRSGVVGIATCDKGLPAMMMALAGTPDLPCVLVPGGTTLLAEEGEDAGRIQSIGARFAHGQITLEYAAEMGCRACASPGGGCQFLGTAATSQVVAEALGMGLPHSALAPSGQPVWLDMARRSGRAVLEMARHGLHMRHVLTPAAIENAMVVHAAFGGSTNLILHLPAVAHAAGLRRPTVADWAAVNRRVPRLVDCLPNGPTNYVTAQVFLAGAVPEVMLHLRAAGLIDTRVTTVAGETLGALLDWWESSERRAKVRELLQTRDGIDPDNVIFSPDTARRRGLTSTVCFPAGNLAPGGSVIKSTSIDPSVVDADGVYRKRGPARVFTSEPSAIAAIKDGRIHEGDILVLICRGPMGSGMEETYQLTSALKYLPFGKHVAVLTDARFSGVSTGACIGHISPEALAGGPIGKVRDGDLIEIIVDREKLEGSIHLLSDDPARRPPRADLAPDPGLPADTRLWAALQDAGGGAWGGAVYDVDAILRLLEAGKKALGEAADSTIKDKDPYKLTPPMNAPTLDLKKTVNLPRTDFSMKANLPQREPEMLAHWQKENLYGKIRESRRGRPMFVLHDGPPYANGNIHLGHALNKLLKDFIVKSKTMSGYDSPYVPGWDCHGLPIEIKIDNQLGPKKAKMTVAQIRKACREYAQKYVDLQRKDFIRLGVFGEWDHPYLTMSAQYESVIARTFVDFLEKGYVYKGLKSVNWCVHDKTALAEAEIEYENHRSPSIWVRFRLKSDPTLIDAALAGREVYGLIWTTTPWTIPANVAISYHPKFEYVAVEANGAVYIVALELMNATAAKAGWKEHNVLAAFPGAKLEGAIFQHPLIERDSLGILGEHVTLEQGTGAVHTAPGHGAEDFEVATRYGIGVYCPVDGAGRFYNTEGAEGEIPAILIGKTVWEGNPIVKDLLRQAGALVAEEDIDHSYPHCWRCHNATIFRATEQWFIGMERNDLRQRTLHAIKQVKWMPSWGDERMSNMIATRPDWCISRQRVWGVPITVFYCEQCQQPLTERKVLDRVVNLFAEQTSDVWYSKSAAELIGEGHECSRCGGHEFRKESDILDVWFESGSSHLAVLTPDSGLPWPSDFYLEGGDQYRGWFHSSLLIGVALKGEAPYRGCATNGWTLDADGRAMSKSLGNGIEPEEIIKKYGADLLRLWCASVDFTEDVRLSDTIISRLTEAYRKFRNTFRWAMGNLDGFDPETGSVPASELLDIDAWMLLRAEDVVAKCRTYYDEYAFHKVYRTLYDFVTTDLSAMYFDAAKDRLYTGAPKSQIRRSAQTALYRITDAMLRLMAPILAFTTEEAWGQFQRPPGGPESVHMAYFPEPAELSQGMSSEQRSRLENWEKLLPVREQVLRALETARQEKFIGAPLEARVRLSADGDLYRVLERFAADLPGLFIVSQVAVEPGGGELHVAVERAEGLKCERCWKYLPEVGKDPEFPTICQPCKAAVLEMGAR